MVRGYFEHLYRDEDPYGVLDSEEEARKRAQTLEAVEGLRFESALEIGCGEGILAEGLAPRCDALRLVDLSERALRRAAERMEPHDHVRVSRLDLLADPIEGDFDLVVCSEVLVYIPVERLDRARDKILAHLRPGGRLLLVHSRSVHDDEQGLEYKDIGARTVHGLFLEDGRLEVESDDEYDMYRITLLRREASA